jgi:predicted dehydrogenase
MDKVAIGLYGTNGHQIQRELVDHPHGRLAATAAFDRAALPEPLRADASIRHYAALEEMLADPRVELVSLCSPRRRDQAFEAIRCLRAGKHVYAEKPCAMTEEDLDAILAAVRETGLQFREMANGVCDTQPFLAMRRAVEAGVIGTVVQVLAQKSYPYRDSRPQDEDVDGGLIGQAAGHALRFIEQVAGVRISAIRAVETQLGNPRQGGLQMAASIMMTLANGGVASAIANYFNPRAFGTWGNEALRVFGTKGFVEAVDGATKTRLVLNEKDCGPLDTGEPSVDYLDCVLLACRGQHRMSRDLADEVHATRMTIRAKRSAVRAAGGVWEED